MDHRDVRELVRIRHELRRFCFSDAGPGTGEAGLLLDRLVSLAARDPAEAAAVEPEVRRWRLRLGLV